MPCAFSDSSNDNVLEEQCHSIITRSKARALGVHTTNLFPGKTATSKEATKPSEQNTQNNIFVPKTEVFFF